jgi:NTE family protein
VDLADAGLIIGTSAGSAVGAQLAAGADPEERYQRELDAPSPDELVGNLGALVLLRWARTGLATRSHGPQAAGQAFGRLALSARTVSEAERLTDLASRMPVREWPRRRLLIIALETESGERTVFDAASGAPILDAVAASCAVPGVWPPVTIAGRRYIDGGVRSPVNADLITGCDRVVVLAPNPAGFLPGSSAAEQVARFGDRAVVVSPDRAAKRAIGRKVLDPARRGPAAEAGYAQAADAAGRIAEVWGAPGAA